MHKRERGREGGMEAERFMIHIYGPYKFEMVRHFYIWYYCGVPLCVGIYEKGPTDVCIHMYIVDRG